jgi:hypothetical protein
MPVSFAQVSTQNMELTPMRVSFGTAGSEVDLGGTLSNVVVSVGISKAEIKADQSGVTVRDRRVSGQVFTVTTELAEIQDKDIWKVVFPHAKLVDDGFGNKMMYFEAAIGDSDLANSKRLILHPLSKQDSDKSGDYTFFLACSSAESEITYGPEEQARLKIVWNILPDDSVQPERFFIHGDNTIGIVNATAAAAVPGGGNTGDGTVGSIVAYNGYTRTETITLDCVQAIANGGKFIVTGSLSGLLGVATVGANFSAPEISFTIADGATDFIVGDTFTIATVAANYS